MRSRKPQIGDIVHHCLFLRYEWSALLLKIEKQQGDTEKGFVKMIPGTKYEDYFLRIKESSNGYGWVYKKWLWVYIQEEST